jgi:hypothetical protein
MSFTAAAMTWGDVRDWIALMVVAAAIFFTASKVRERRSKSRRRQFLARFKATREGRRFHEDLEERDKE